MKENKAGRNETLASRLWSGLGGALSAAVELDSLRGKVNVVVLAFGILLTQPVRCWVFSLLLFTPRAKAGLTFGFFLCLVAPHVGLYQILMNFDLIHLEDALAWSGLEARDGKLTPLIHTAWASVTVFITWLYCLFR